MTERKLTGVFFGTSEFAVPALRAFAERVSCRLVVTQPDRAAGRGHKLQPAPVKLAANELGIPTIEPGRLRDAIPTLREVAADLYAVASYGKIVPQAILDLPRCGALNVHPSLLPLYRGATPLQSQLRDGVTNGGVTIIVMDAGMDTGDIALQERATVGPYETYGELHDRFAALGAELLGRACEAVAADRLRPTPQKGLAPDDEIVRTTTRPLSKADLMVDWTWPVKRVVDLVRSLAPQPLARGEIGGETVKLVAVNEVASPRDSIGDDVLAAGRPGDLISVRSGRPELVVRCGDGAVAVRRLVAPSRGQMDGAAYAQRLRDLPPLLSR